MAFALIGLFIAFYLPYPVSFFITSLAFFTYIGVRVYDWASHRGRALPRPQSVHEHDGH
jgi:hypothetical protein